MASITDIRIRNWIKAGRKIAKADGGGLTFTLSASGTPAWILRYRFGGKHRELTLGRYPDISLAKARELASAARARIQQGLDVGREKQIAARERAAANTFRQLASSYMEVAFPAMAHNTIRQRRRHIEDILIPKLGRLAARDVETADSRANSRSAKGAVALDLRRRKVLFSASWRPMTGACSKHSPR